MCLTIIKLTARASIVNQEKLHCFVLGNLRKIKIKGAEIYAM